MGEEVMVLNWEPHGRSTYHLGCHIEREVKQQDGKHVDFHHEFTATVSVEHGSYALLVLKGNEIRTAFTSLVMLNHALTQLGYPKLRIT